VPTIYLRTMLIGTMRMAGSQVDAPMSSLARWSYASDRGNCLLLIGCDLKSVRSQSTMASPIRPFLYHASPRVPSARTDLQRGGCSLSQGTVTSLIPTIRTHELEPWLFQEIHHSSGFRDRRPIQFGLSVSKLDARSSNASSSSTWSATGLHSVVMHPE
jgi:hypothetical protein